jgi:hypothetical protein
VTVRRQINRGKEREGKERDSPQRQETKRMRMGEWLDHHQEMTAIAVVAEEALVEFAETAAVDEVELREEEESERRSQRSPLMMNDPLDFLSDIAISSQPTRERPQWT